MEEEGYLPEITGVLIGIILVFHNLFLQAIFLGITAILAIIVITAIQSSL